MLSQSVGYAVSALGCIATAGGRPVLVKEIAEAADIPQSYLAKIIHSLARRGIVTTQRGVGGGVVLARPATEISLFDVCIAMDDPAVRPLCMLGNAICSDERECPAHRFWMGHRTKYLDFLRTTCISHIAAFDARRRWKAATPPLPAIVEPGAGPNGARAPVNGTGLH